VTTLIPFQIKYVHVQKTLIESGIEEPAHAQSHMPGKDEKHKDFRFRSPTTTRRLFNLLWHAFRKQATSGIQKGKSSF